MRILCGNRLGQDGCFKALFRLLPDACSGSAELTESSIVESAEATDKVVVSSLVGAIIIVVVERKLQLWIENFASERSTSFTGLTNKTLDHDPDM